MHSAAALCSLSSEPVFFKGCEGDHCVGIARPRYLKFEVQLPKLIRNSGGELCTAELESRKSQMHSLCTLKLENAFAGVSLFVNAENISGPCQDAMLGLGQPPYC